MKNGLGLQSIRHSLEVNKTQGKDGLCDLVFKLKRGLSFVNIEVDS